MRNLRIIKILLTFLVLIGLTSCATTKHTLLVDPNLPAMEKQQILENWKIDYDSARSIKENSTVGIGAYLSEYSKEKQVLTLSVKITNTSNKAIITPAL